MYIFILFISNLELEDSTPRLNSFYNLEKAGREPFCNLEKKIYPPYKKKERAGGFIGSTKLIAHFSNSSNSLTGCKGILSLLEGFPTLWHTSQVLAGNNFIVCKRDFRFLHCFIEIFLQSSYNFKKQLFLFILNFKI